MITELTEQQASHNVTRDHWGDSTWPLEVINWSQSCCITCKCYCTTPYTHKHH